MSKPNSHQVFRVTPSHPQNNTAFIKGGQTFFVQGSSGGKNIGVWFQIAASCPKPLPAEP